MAQVGDYAEASERLKAAILAKFGHYSTFARLVPMEATQLSATLRPHRRPTVETLDRFSVVLEWPPNELREWYGYVVADDDDDPPAPPPPPPALARDSDHLSVAEMVRQVEEWPGKTFTQRREANKIRLAGKPGAYERWCVRLFKMWEMNADMVFGLIDDQPV